MNHQADTGISPALTVQKWEPVVRLRRPKLSMYSIDMEPHRLLYDRSVLSAIKHALSSGAWRFNFLMTVSMINIPINANCHNWHLTWVYKIDEANLRTSPGSSLHYADLMAVSVFDQQKSKSVTLEEFGIKFARLSREWKEETLCISSLSKIYAHPAYQSIIGMGIFGVPFVLKELERDNGPWFYALKFMAGKDISEGIDNFKAAKAAWLKWGRENKHI